MSEPSSRGPDRDLFRDTWVRYLGERVAEDLANPPLHGRGRRGRATPVGEAGRRGARLAVILLEGELAQRPLESAQGRRARPGQAGHSRSLPYVPSREKRGPSWEEPGRRLPTLGRTCKLGALHADWGLCRLQDSPLPYPDLSLSYRFLKKVWGSGVHRNCSAGWSHALQAGCPGRSRLVPHFAPGAPRGVAQKP